MTLWAADPGPRPGVLHIQAREGLGSRAAGS
jgi:hypothetical protein